MNPARKHPRWRRRAPRPLPVTVGSESGVRRASIAAVALVAAVAAVVSYAHMQQLADAAGEQWRSHLLPLSVDGLLVAAAISMLVSRMRGQDPTLLARISLALGIVASLAANVAAAEATLAGRLVAAWPPVALALAFELLTQQTLTRTTAAAGVEHTSDTAAAYAPDAVAQDAAAHDAPDSAPTAARNTAAERQARPAPKCAPRTRPARAGQGAQKEQARALFDRARAQGSADELTGSDLARVSGAHPGTARKWLAAWRADVEKNPTTTAPAEDAPRLAVVGQHAGGAQ